MRRLRGRNNSNRRNNSSRPHNFDSNGPDVKVRGNAQQVVEKYLQLARDAATAGDPVTAENYYQHAEHYHRIQTANGGSQPQPEAANGASQPAEALPKAAPAGTADDVDIPASKPAAASVDEGSTPDAG